MLNHIIMCYLINGFFATSAFRCIILCYTCAPYSTNIPFCERKLNTNIIFHLIISYVTHKVSMPNSINLLRNNCYIN